MEYETYADVIDAYNADNMGYSTLTDYIKGQNIKIKEIEMDPIGDMQKIFENKADGGMIGIEVLFRDKKANGGRVPMVSGGALKGLMSLFKGGDKAADLVKQEEIFRTGPITTKFLEDVDNKVIDKFIRTRDTKGPGSYGMYDNFDDMPAGLKAAELISRIRKPGGGIDYEAAELFIGKKLKGDETIDELIDMVISEPIGSGKSANLEELMADGGRVGLFMGGDPLTGQALQIYNSMKGYNFSDQEIADALSARGLYTPAGSGTGTETTAPNIIGAQINQGRDTGPTRPTSEIVADFQETITNRQNKLNNPGKIASFVGDFIPQQRSIADMLASGQVDTRLTSGIPLGIGSMIGRALPDKYYDMSLADQITTQAYMGFTDPNTNMANKDPFGLNVRSAFGNYAEKAAEIVDTLTAKGTVNGVFDINNLSNYDKTRFNHYRNVTKTKQDAIADIGLINLAKEQAEAKRQEALKKIQAQGKMDYNPNIHGPVNYGKDSQGNQSFDSGMGFGIGSDGGPVSNRTGRGRTGYSEGGLATMFTRRR